MFKKFLIGTLAVVAFLVTANLALASYDFGTAILKVGSRGQYVTTLQNLVGATPADGNFGPITKGKVVAWQTANGLTADGLFGNLSKTKANEIGVNFSVGCTNASGFSTTTGFPCSSLNAHTFPAGCTNASGFSTTTGLNCLNNLPPIRGGGSIGEHHRDTVIYTTAIEGVTVPVAGATPVTAVIAGTGYTGTVTWSGTPTTFSGNTAYTATITLTVASGYTLTGVTANQFTIAGSTSDTNSANSGVITAVFSATELIQLTIGDGTLTTTKTYDGDRTAEVTAGDLNGVIAPDYVTVTAVATYDNANAGEGKNIIVTYTLGGTNAGNYIAPIDLTVSNGVITAVQLTNTTPTITLSKPYDGNNTATITAPGTLGGKIGSEVVSIDTETATYNDATIATGKTITVVYTITGADAGNYIAPVNDSSISNGVITSVDITVAGVTGFIAPVIDVAPEIFGSLMSADATKYSVTGLTWSPVANPYLGTQAYTATVTLTSVSGYKFPVGNIASPTADVGTVNSIGTTSGGNVTGNTLSYTVLFPATANNTVHVTDSGTLIAAGIDPAVGTIILDNAIELSAALILDNGAKTVDLNTFALTVSGNPITANANGSILENGDITGAVAIGGDGTGFLVDGVDFSGTLTTNNTSILEDNISFHDGSIFGAITSTVPAKQFDGTYLTAAIAPGTGTVFMDLTILGAVTARNAATYDTVMFDGAVTVDTSVSRFTYCTFDAGFTTADVATIANYNTFNFAVTNTSGNSDYTGSTFKGVVTNTLGNAAYNYATFTLTSTLILTAGSPTFIGTIFDEAVAEVDKITAGALGTITVGDASTILQKAQALVSGGYTVTIKAEDGVKIVAGVATVAGAGTISFTVTKGITPFTADTGILNITVN